METRNTHEPKHFVVGKKQFGLRKPIVWTRSDTLIPWIATTAILGLAGVTLLERLVPVLPSTALLLALGVAVREGHWSMIGALWSSTAGSLL